MSKSLESVESFEKEIQHHREQAEWYARCAARAGLIDQRMNYEDRSRHHTELVIELEEKLSTRKGEA